MSKVYTRTDILKTISARRWTLNTNIFYKDVFSGSDNLKIICSCGRPQTIGVKSLEKYICSYCNNSYKKINYKDFRVCPICEKPHFMKTKCCKKCNDIIK